MKTIKPTCLKLLVLWATLAGTLPAHAYYDPGIQRWLNRDPLGDVASLPLVTATIAPPVKNSDGEAMTDGEFFDVWRDINRNVYVALGNTPIGFIDALGLSPSLNPANQAAAADCIETAAQAGARKLAQEVAQKEALKQAAKEAAQKAAKEQAAKKAAQKAAEKMAKDMAKRIEKDLGKEARREFHDAKHLTDRTADELKRDAAELYKQYGGSCPGWMRP